MACNCANHKHAMSSEESRSASYRSACCPVRQQLEKHATNEKECVILTVCTDSFISLELAFSAVSNRQSGEVCNTLGWTRGKK